jgi:hypothetical protein
MKKLFLILSLFFNFQASLIAVPVLSKVPVVGKIAHSVDEKDVVKIFIVTTVSLGVVLVSINFFDRGGFSSYHARRMRTGINIHDLKLSLQNKSSSQQARP